MVAILDLEVSVTSKLQNNHCIVFTMLKSVENDTSFAFLSYTVPEIMHLVFFRWQMAAILDLEVAMTLKVKKDNCNGFVTLKSVRNDTSFAFVAYLGLDILHFMFFEIGSAAFLNFALWRS